MQSKNTTSHDTVIRNIKRGAEARKAIFAGAEALAKAVTTTLGPRGRNVAMEKNYGSPLVTKDGVSVASEVDLEDPFENMGVRMMRDASSKTSDDAGDGTTTSTVLAFSMYREGLKLVEAGFNPVFLKRGMDKAALLLEELLLGMSTSVDTIDQIEQVGTISANGDARVGKILAEAIDKVGKDGVINIEESQGIGLEIEVKEGMQLDRGAVLTDFLIRDGIDIRLDNALIFVTDLPVGDIRLLAKMLNQVVEGGRPLVLIAPDFSQESVAAFYQNFAKGNLIAVPIRAPGFGDRQTQYLQDISVLTGATFVTKALDMQFEKVTLSDLGSAVAVTVTRNTTTILGGSGDPTALIDQINKVKGEISRCSSEFDREKLQERLAKLTGGVCSVKVGAHSEIEVKELKARIEDALHATRSSVAEGIVPGGGTALLRAGAAAREILSSGSLEPELTPTTEEEKVGWDLVVHGTEAPIRAILRNAGLSSSVLIDRLLKEEDTSFGVDATDGTIKDMYVHGIVDPLRVVRHALLNATSVAGTMLTTELLIVKPQVLGSPAGTPASLGLLPTFR